jgi:hypothetical protein
VLQPFMSFGLLDHNFTKAVTREEWRLHSHCRESLKSYTVIWGFLMVYILYGNEVSLML